MNGIHRRWTCAVRFIALSLAALALAGCDNEPDPIMTGGMETPAQVALKDPPKTTSAASTSTGPAAGPGPADNSGPAAPDASQPLNPQTVHKIIEDNITMREEIRRLKIERENLIRLLRAMGENYEPVDENK